MVRLRREIEGIHLDRSVPPPPWATSNLTDRLVCPTWPDAVRALDGSRLLFCGIPDEALALERAAAGHWVTICDLVAADVRRISVSLTPDVASRVQLVAKPYGSATFSPSSFDAIVLSDQLHAYDAPAWVLQKVKRELKVDGVLLARLHVAGELGDLPDGVAVPVGDPPAPWQTRAIARMTRLLAKLVRSPAAPLWLDPVGLDAVQRCALWSETSAAMSLCGQLDAIASRLHVEEIHIGSTLRAATVLWAAGAQPPAAALALRVAERLPALADETDRTRHGARAVWVRARRALMTGGKALTFG